MQRGTPRAGSRAGWAPRPGRRPPRPPSSSRWSSGRRPLPCTGLPPPAAFCAPGSSPPSECPRSADRKSTRLNSSHLVISYAVFCLKKKKNDILLPLHLADSHSSLDLTATLLLCYVLARQCLDSL